jgi:hypothetical protein
MTESPFSPKAAPVNRPAVLAYYIALWGLIPFVGMILGPIAALLGWRALRRGQRQPDFNADGPGLAAVVLGLAEAVTQWAGAALIWLGW